MGCLDILYSVLIGNFFKLSGKIRITIKHRITEKQLSNKFPNSQLCCSCLFATISTWMIYFFPHCGQLHSISWIRLWCYSNVTYLVIIIIVQQFVRSHNMSMGIIRVPYFLYNLFCTVAHLFRFILIL